MSDYQPIRFPFNFTGIDLVNLPDRLPPGKLSFAVNVRSLQEGGITSRPGYGAPLNASPFDQTSVHSIKTVSNTLPGVSPTVRRFVGAGTKLYEVTLGVLDTGYSGNPLSMVVYRPDQSVASTLYVADSARMSKIAYDGTRSSIGIAPPTKAPSLSLSAPLYTVVDDFFTTTGWSGHGTSTGGPSVIVRNLPAATIGQILFDTGSTGWACVSPTNGTNDFHWLGVGARMLIGPSGVCSTSGTTVTWVSGFVFDSSWIGSQVNINGVLYTVSTVAVGGHSMTITSSAGTQTNVPFFFASDITVVQEVHTMVTNSTIAGIVYDSGSTGLATVQAATPFVGITLNSMVLLNTEPVRVLSATVGPDGLYSFRCSTTGTHAAAETITGLASFRCYLTVTHVTGENIGAGGLTFGTTAGIGYLAKTVNLDLSQAGGRPLSPEDYMHISLWIDAPANLVEGRLMLNVDATDLNFGTNFYYFPFRPSDISQVITGTQTSIQALASATQNLLLGEVDAARPSPNLVNATNPQLSTSSVVAPSEQLFTGGSNWTEIMIPYSALQRVGADATRSIANVNAIAIWLNCSATVNCEASAWWVGGSYGPDTFPPTTQPYLYRYRYRSSVTGAKSQQSPGTRSTLVANPDGSVNGSTSGIQAFRQAIVVTGATSGDSQVDQVDFERLGGNLNTWTFVGTAPNTGTPTFTDTFSDDEQKTSPPLETDAVQPFPSFDIPRTGTVNVIGTRVVWASGDHFSTSWAPGTEILIAGVAYTVYGQPLSTTILDTVENVGVVTGASFLVAEPTLIGQPAAFLIGPFAGGFFLSWGDPRNPGTIRATKGNDPDSAPISYYLEVSSPSEPIIGGTIYDDNAVIASNKRWWRIGIDGNAIASGQGNVLVSQEIPVGPGLFSPWAISVGDPGIFFLGSDGIPYLTTGSTAQNLIENDLRPLFPSYGNLGQAIG